MANKRHLKHTFCTQSITLVFYQNTYHIWSLIFFPPNSTVLILKSIPEITKALKVNQAFIRLNRTGAPSTKPFLTEVKILKFDVKSYCIFRAQNSKVCPPDQHYLQTN